MTLKIFAVSHAPSDIQFANDVFSPFLIGVDPQAAGGFPTDMGSDLAGRNSYSEMRAHYHVWKTRPAGLDHVGFQHYRRLFFFTFLDDPPQFPIVRQIRAYFLKNRRAAALCVSIPQLLQYMQVLRELAAEQTARLRERIAEVDLVVPRAYQPEEGSLAAQYGHAHRAEDWQALLGALRRTTRFRALGHAIDTELPELSLCNLYIMRWPLFDDYMRFWQEVCAALEGVVSAADGDYQSRAFAFLSERIFTIYLYHLRLEQPALRVLELPFLFCDTVRL